MAEEVSGYDLLSDLVLKTIEERARTYPGSKERAQCDDFLIKAFHELHLEAKEAEDIRAKFEDISNKKEVEIARIEAEKSEADERLKMEKRNELLKVCTQAGMFVGSAWLSNVFDIRGMKFSETGALSQSVSNLTMRSSAPFTRFIGNWGK